MSSVVVLSSYSDRRHRLPALHAPRAYAGDAAVADAIDEVIARTLRIDPSLVRDELAYQSVVEWDSMAHMALMAALEAHLSVSIDADRVPELVTVAAIRAFALGVDPVGPDGGAQESGPKAVQRGLAGVVFDRTRISEIDGANGRLSVRGYDIDDLAAEPSYADVVHLLVEERLPTAAERDALLADLGRQRLLPDEVQAVVVALAEAHPNVALRTAVSMLSAREPARLATDRGALSRAGIRLIAQAAEVLVAHRRASGAVPFVEVPSGVPFAEAFLWRMLGARPSPLVARLIERDFVVHAEHGSNGSAFAARVAAGTHANLHACVTAALAVFEGELHGGAAERVIEMIDAIGTPKAARRYVHDRLGRNEPVMGFGHRVYRTEDPRARHLRDAAELLAAESGERGRLDVLEALVDAMADHRRHGLAINVDFYTGVSYELMGIPRAYFVPLFSLARMPGWIAHVIEQASNNILIRPLLAYEGETRRLFQPVELRGS
jgi:citrate synthase